MIFIEMLTHSAVYINQICYLVRDRAKAAVEKSIDSLAHSSSASQRIMDKSLLIETHLQQKLKAMQNARHVGISDIPKLGKFRGFCKWIKSFDDIQRKLLLQLTKRARI